MSKHIPIFVRIVAVVAFTVGMLSVRSGVKAQTNGSRAPDTSAVFLKDIQARGVLRVGCAQSPPTIYQNPDGSWAGPDLLPLQRLADILHVKFETVGTTWQNMVTGLEAGKYDFAADLDATGERALAIRYTVPSWKYPSVFVVPENTPYRTSEALLGANKPIAVPSGTAQDLALRTLNANELRLDDYSHAVLALDSGRAIAMFADNGTAVDFVRKQPSLKIIVPNPTIFVHGVAYGVPASIDEHSLQVIDIVIDNMVDSGEIKRAFAKAGFLNVNQLGNLELKP